MFAVVRIEPHTYGQDTRCYNQVIRRDDPVLVTQMSAAELWSLAQKISENYTVSISHNPGNAKTLVVVRYSPTDFNDQVAVDDFVARIANWMNEARIHSGLKPPADITT